MIPEFLGFTWSVLLSFVTSPWSLVTGTLSLLSVTGTLGLVLLVAGVILVIRAPEAHDRWLLPMALCSIVSPAILDFARSGMGWFGMLFALVAGVAGLLLWTGMLASDADRRAPIWLSGLGLIGFTVYAGLVGIIIVWSGG